jgi:hypothetical protein
VSVVAVYDGLDQAHENAPRVLENHVSVRNLVHYECVKTEVEVYADEDDCRHGPQYYTRKVPPSRTISKLPFELTTWLNIIYLFFMK